MIFFGFFLIFFGIFIALIISRYYSILQPFSIWHSEKSGKDCEIKKKMILLIAHPDDESMFFIPSLLSFIEYYNIDILCLSNGNYDDLGKLRELELQKVANFLKINNLKIINHAKLQDGMSEKWDISLIKSLIQEYYNEKPFEIILTFDENGVSDHPNHIAVSKGVKAFSNDFKDIGSKPELYELISVNIIRKYIGLLDIFSNEKNDLTLINLNVFKNWKAMQLHYSQFVWFRKLFVFFSRYTFINTLKRYSG